MADEKKIGLIDIAKDALKGIGKVGGELIDRLVPQGRDELANALFNGNAYWPGTHPGTPTDTQQPAQPGGIDAAQDAQPPQPGKDAPDASPGATVSPPEPPRDPPPGGAISYREQLNQTAALGGQDQDRGRGMSR
jgi:hypothetical protein